MYKKLVLTFGIKILIALLNLAIVIMLSKHLGAAGKGEASLIITSIAMILLFCNIVGGSSLVYFVPRQNIVQLLLLSNGWSVIVCILCYFLLLIIPLINPSAVVPVIILSIINSFLASNLTVLLGKEKINTHNLVLLLQASINIVILWFMVKGLDQNNVGSYIISLYAAMGLCFVVSMIFLIPLIKADKLKKDNELLSKLFKYGASSQAGHIMKFMSFRCTYYMLLNYTGEAALGIFSNGVSLIESVFLISNSIATVLYPKVANSADRNYSKKLTLQFTKLSIVLCICALVPLVLLPSDFFVWLFGNEFAYVHQVIIILAPGVLFYNIALVVGHYFSGTGRFKINTIANFVGLVTTILLALLFSPHFGIKEVSIVSSISYITTTAIILFYFYKDAGINSFHLFPDAEDLKWLKLQARSILKK
jgi:O-antigen/teichoic acid export membrane protein